jgi:hypothetical protein
MAQVGIDQLLTSLQALIGQQAVELQSQALLIQAQGQEIEDLRTLLAGRGEGSDEASNGATP